MNRYPKKMRQKLRELSSLAYDRELNQKLDELSNGSSLPLTHLRTIVFVSACCLAAEGFARGTRAKRRGVFS